MDYALIKLLKTSVKQIVETKNIIDFDCYVKNPRNNDVYAVQEGKWKKSCIILLTGATEDEVKKKRTEKRVADPKINDSDILADVEIEDRANREEVNDDGKKKDNSDGQDDESVIRDDEDLFSKRIKKNKPTPVIDSEDEDISLEEEKRMIRAERKRLQEQKDKAKMEAESSILQAYKKAQLNSITVDKTLKSTSSEANKANKSRDAGHGTDYECKENSMQKSPNDDDAELLALADDQTRTKHLKRNAITLAKSQPTKTMKTSRVVQSEQVYQNEPCCSWHNDNLLDDQFQREEHPSHPVSRGKNVEYSPRLSPRMPLRSQPLDNNRVVRNLFDDEENLKPGVVRGLLYHLGDNVWVKEESFDKARHSRDANKFVTSMAYGIWGYEALSNRCVKQMKGRETPLLSPKKVSMVRKYFSKYLKERECDKNTYLTEMSKVNVYLGRAIGAAKKRIAAQKKK